MLQRLVFLSILAASLLSHHAVAQQATSTNMGPVVDEAVQTFLRNMLSPNEREMFSGTEEEIRAKFTQLRDMVGGDTKVLVGQLLYFSMRAKGMREAMLSGVIIQQLGISKDDIARAVLPLLDAEDARLREKARNLLGEVESSPSHKGPDFSRYESIIRERKADVPQGLIDHMYATSPDAALASLATVYLDKDEAKALVDQVRGEDDAHAVDRLSQRQEWWAHLYVVAMMEKNPSLRTSEVVRRLDADTNPLVREKVSKLKDKLQPK